jgi:putative tricarboxylic transport membrane protein
VFTSLRSRATVASSIDARAIALIALAIALSVLLINAAGFIIASIALFWLTARAFDRRHPVRDAIAAVVLSVGAYVLFAGVLQIQLP